jgi:hypothetical protein
MMSPFYISPDAVIGLVSTAGWNVKEHYADSNRSPHSNTTKIPQNLHTQMHRQYAAPTRSPTPHHLCRFFMHDVALPTAAAKSILEATTEDGNALLSACNMGLQDGGGRRVHLRVGEMDAAVPPWQVTTYCRRWCCSGCCCCC